MILFLQLLWLRWTPSSCRLLPPQGPTFFTFTGTDSDGTPINSAMDFEVVGGATTANFIVRREETAAYFASGEAQMVKFIGDYSSAVTSTTTLVVNIKATNPRALGTPLYSIASQVIVVRPFAGPTSPVDLSQVQLDWSMPNPCSFAAAVTSPYCTSSARRASTPSYLFEVWVRRSFDCSASLCPNMVAGLF